MLVVAYPWRWMIVITCVCASLPSCKRKEDSAGPAAARQMVASAHDATQPAEAGPVAPERSTIETAKVSALLDRWLSAQNQGDFDAYSACYAARFEGIKRVGARASRFDRAGWLADRKRMFRRAMEVAIRDVEIRPLASTAVVQLTQRWASGKYEDIGPKQLVIVSEGDAVRISREEMMASQILSSRDAPAFDMDLGLIDEVDGGSYLLLGRSSREAHGPLRLLDDGEPVVVIATVDPRKASPAVARWHGQTVLGGTCAAKVTGFAEIVRVVPHFNERHAWEGLYTDDPPYSREEIAAAAWAMSTPYIGARLDFSGAAPDCEHTGIARPAGQSPVSMAEPVMDAALLDRAVNAFRRLPAYAEIQEEYVTEGQDDLDVLVGRERPRAERWDESDDAKGPAAHGARNPDSGEIRVYVHAQAGRGCGSFLGTLAVIFRVDARTGELLVVTTDAPVPNAIQSAYVIDGELAFLMEVGYGYDWMLVTGEGEVILRVDGDYFDCPC